MLFFLYHAARFGAVVDRYEDAAVGEQGKLPSGKFWISRVTLNPKVTWGAGKVPSASELETLHHKAHEDCYIANSVKSEVVISG
jgi:organic hydroperoxide reductase OsmC/OhrA